MPVSEHPGYDSYVGNAVTTVFAFTFRIFEESDMLVELDGVAQTLTTDYTISAVGEGGNVTFVTAPGSGVIVNLSGEVPYDRSTDYIANGDLRAATLDDDLDKATVLTQQLTRDFGRSFILAYEDLSGMTTLLPTPVADRFFAWNSTGTAIQYIDPGSVELATPASESVDADKIDTGDTAAIRTKLDVMDTTTLTATYLAKAGGTMTGKIVLDDDATAALNPTPARQIQKGLLTNIVDTGAADAYVGTLAPAISTYTARMVVGLVIANANLTTTPTFDLNSISADTIKRIGSAALLVGDLPVGHLAFMAHDGTDWILLNPALHDHSNPSQGGSLGAQPAFSVHRGGSAQTVATATWTKINFDTEEFDTNSDFDATTNYNFIPTVAGKYLLTAASLLTTDVNAAAIFYIAIYKNGALYKKSMNYTGSASGIGASISVVVDANGVDDDFDIRIYQNGGGTESIGVASDESWFTGHRLDI